MGGIGSGNRWRWGTKATTSEYRSIDVRRWAREGFLTPGNQFGWQWSLNGEKAASIRVAAKQAAVTLIYKHRSHGEHWTDERYDVRLSKTPCNFGGERFWFHCPARGCGRRVAKLYGGAIFACRLCHNLSYPSQNENAGERAIRRAEIIRDRLDWPGGVFEGSGWPKPKNMHWRTYERLCREHDDHMEAAIASELGRLLRLSDLLDASHKGDRKGD